MKFAAFAVSGLFLLAAPGLAPSQAATTLSEADRAFIAKVSQGGMYEVELGRLAEKQGATQDIRDQGNTEAHDHALVGSKLKTVVEKAGGSFPARLNAEFQGKLDKIGALHGAEFDRAYLDAMKTVHAGDGAAFLKESKEGSDPALKAFALETYRIVQRHIGELDVNVP